MTLPNAEIARVDWVKVVGYLLDPAHPDGAGKARFFHGLGFRKEEWEVFAQALRAVATRNPAASALRTEHGCKYIIDGALDSPSKRRIRVRTVWICDTGAEIPRLVTAYPLKEEASHD